MFFSYGLKENFRPVMRNEKVFRQFEIKISTGICFENTLRAEVSLPHGVLAFTKSFAWLPCYVVGLFTPCETPLQLVVSVEHAL